MKKQLIPFQIVLLIFILSYGRSLLAYTMVDDVQLRHQVRQAFLNDTEAVAVETAVATPCVGGFAGAYPCSSIDLLAHMPLSSIGGGSGNDIWGWTDPQTGKEYAIMGRTTGTTFVDISQPENPIYLGNLPKQAGTSTNLWRDIKIYKNHAYVVSEALNHGIQIFDLTQLRHLVITPTTFANTAHYDNFGKAHNIVINEETGYAYAVGVNNSGSANCGGGLHIVNIISPTNPTFAGCFSADGYTHDAQCVTYNGPDAAHLGSEICFNYNTDTVTIADVTDKDSPTQLSRTGYAGSRYTHQGWLTENHTYILVNDELDENQYGHNTRTYVWDVADLEEPTLVFSYTATTPAIDHNLYIDGKYIYQSNYRAGLRILNGSDIANTTLTEVAYFDVYPNNDNIAYSGTWSNYPYFESGVVAVSSIEGGLFLLQPTALDTTISTPTAVSTLTISYDGTLATLNWSDTGAEVYDVWASPLSPYFTPTESCAQAQTPARCVVVSSNTEKDTNSNMAQFYTIVPRNFDGGTNTSTTEWVGFMRFPLTSGS